MNGLKTLFRTKQNMDSFADAWAVFTNYCTLSQSTETPVVLKAETEVHLANTYPLEKAQISSSWFAAQITVAQSAFFQ